VSETHEVEIRPNDVVLASFPHCEFAFDKKFFGEGDEARPDEIVRGFVRVNPAFAAQPGSHQIEHRTITFNEFA
jgi:hypothetical protein